MCFINLPSLHGLIKIITMFRCHYSLFQPLLIALLPVVSIPTNVLIYLHVSSLFGSGFAGSEVHKEQLWLILSIFVFHTAYFYFNFRFANAVKTFHRRSITLCDLKGYINCLTY